MMQEACGMVRKAKRQRRLSREGTSTRMPLAGVCVYRLLLRCEEVNIVWVEAKHLDL